MTPTLSSRQMATVEHAVSDDVLCLSVGATRGGKTFASVLGFAVWAMDQPPGREFLLAGQSLSALDANVVLADNGLLDTLKALGFEPHDTQAAVECDGRRFRKVGANDTKARRRIQGATLAGGLFDELALLHEDFWNMAWTRFSLPAPKVWATCNPEGPAHWLKRNVVDRLDAFDGALVPYTLDDNPALPDAYKDRLRATLTGHWAARLIEGHWAAAGGVIWPRYTLQQADVEPVSWSVALDWAASGTFACLLVASCADRTAVVTQERYHSADTDGFLAELEQLEATVAWLSGCGVDPVGVTCWVDPATPSSFKRMLRKSGLHVRNADNDVVPGIMTTAGRLASGNIRISPGCTKLLAEVQDYQWDPSGQEQGIDRPLKTRDHGCDALRYFAHSTGKVAALDRPLTTKEAGLWR